jgi:hypothetical protein
MTDEQKAAYVIAQSACMLAVLESMKAENAMCDVRGVPREHSSVDFEDLPNQYGVHHNAVMGLFHP